MLGALSRVVSLEACCQWAMMLMMMESYIYIAQSFHAVVAMLGAIGRVVSLEARCQWAMLMLMMMMMMMMMMESYIQRSHSMM